MLKKLSIFGWKPSGWAGFMPNGWGQIKPNHYLDMLKIAWKNRDSLPYALRILQKGVCDGCALGTTGMHDFTMKGIHLCTVRLNLLRLNTIHALNPRLLRDVSSLRQQSSAELRDLGRIPYPMVRRRGEPGFKRVSWSEALDLIAGRIRGADPRRLAFYLTSRGMSNEVYYVAQKVARFLGTNNIDNASRICHAPSTYAMKSVLGVAASTCSYKDWIGTDLIILVGSDVANNQPVTTKYIYYAKQKGTRVLVLNPYKEPGLQRYWVPSVPESAVFGTKLADEFFQIHTGGDIAFINGVMKHLIENGWLDNGFIAQHTDNFDDLKASLAKQGWEELERSAGASRAEMLRFAREYGAATSAVFVWSMGITQHRFGVQNVEAIVNLALARGMVGREHCGLMPIRGHSGVQGGAEVGCVPSSLPGGSGFDEASLQRFKELWGFDVPTEPGLTAVEMIDAAHEGKIDVFYSAGGNFLETLPEPHYIKEALERVPLRVHQDLVVTHQMLIDPADCVVLLPATTRYEQAGGATETSTERYIYFSPEIPGQRIEEARSEWQIFRDLAERVKPESRHLIHVETGEQIRAEIARAVPAYDGIQHLAKAGDAVQWGGRLLCCDGVFGTPNGRAYFTTLRPPDFALDEGSFMVTTRRGRQFNSMVYAFRDPLTGATRDDVFMSEEDAGAFGLGEGDPVLLKSEVGELQGTVKLAAIRPRNLQVHWPEGNTLIRRGILDPDCGMPDYDAVVTVTPLAKRDS